jgi:hypothetical protein
MASYNSKESKIKPMKWKERGNIKIKKTHFSGDQ